MTQARHVVVRGRVQGVAFRHHTKVRARGLGLAGWVRNLPDGAVEVWVEGEAAVVEELVAWLRRGPALARVDAVEESAAAPAGHADFSVRFD
jgi:acylphosphatase